MISIGDFNILKQITPEMGLKLKVYNLGSPYEVGCRLFSLIPPLDLDDPNFDTNYANYLMNEPSAFNELMFLIMDEYYGNNAFVSIITDNPYVIEVMESLLKFINFRYGIVVNVVNTIEDLLEAKDYPISGYGLMNMDYDRERFIESLPLDVINEMSRQAMFNDFSALIGKDVIL